MSNAICVQDQCQTFLMYNKTTDSLLNPPDNIVFVPYIKKICETDEGYEVTNYNLDGTPYTDAIEEEIIPGAEDIKQQVMCDGSSSFIRWFVTVKGVEAFHYDTNLDGDAFTPAGEVTVGSCGGAGDNCETLLYYAVDGTKLTSYRVKFCPGEEPIYYD